MCEVGGQAARVHLVKVHELHQVRELGVAAVK